MTNLTNDDLIGLWLDWYRAGTVSPGTLKVRRTHLRRLGEHVDLLTATEDDLVALLASKADLSANYRHALAASFKSFYQWAHRRGFRPDDPTVGLRPVPVPPGLPKPVPEHVLAKALELADAETRLMLLLGAYAGLRRAEIAAVHSEHITGSGLIVKGKGGKERRIPIHPRLAAELNLINGWAFPSTVYPGLHVSPSYISARLDRVLPAPYTPHSLRHRFATMAYRTSCDLRAVQALLGHTKPETTARYTLTGDDDLRRAVLGIAA